MSIEDSQQGHRADWVFIKELSKHVCLIFRLPQSLHIDTDCISLPWQQAKASALRKGSPYLSLVTTVVSAC